jgi:hypothetical protein
VNNVLESIVEIPKSIQHHWLISMTARAMKNDFFDPTAFEKMIDFLSQ